MRKLTIIFLTLAPLSVLANESGKCPVKDYWKGKGTNSVVSYIKKAKSCEEAHGRAKRCSTGASLDMTIFSESIYLCENSFKKNLDVKAKEAYETLEMRCYQYQKENQGTMWVSAHWSCRSELSVFFHGMYHKKSLKVADDL